MFAQHRHSQCARSSTALPASAERIRSRRRSRLSAMCATATAGRGEAPVSLRGRLVLLDRDGVVNVDVGSPGVTSAEDFRLEKGAAAALAKLKLAGASVCLVTNQTCVGKGLVTEDGLEAIHRRMRELLVEEGGVNAVLDDILYATRTADVPCDRRKPAPGMLLEAMTSFDVRKEDATMVGDTVTDMQAAVAAGVEDRVLVGTGYGARVLEAHRAAAAEGATAAAAAATATPIHDDTPFRIMSSADDPSGTLPPETLPLTLCANFEKAAEFLLTRSSPPSKR